jgi:hypothetical protein
MVWILATSAMNIATEEKQGKSEKVREVFHNYGVRCSFTEGYLLSHYIQTKISECFIIYVQKGGLSGVETNPLFGYSMHRSWNKVLLISVLVNLFLKPPSIKCQIVTHDLFNTRTQSSV